jgi:hypothetical protein
MVERRTIFVLVACFLAAFFTAQTFSQARRSNVSPRLPDAERQRKTNVTQKQREAPENRYAKRSQFEGKQRLKALEEKSAEAKREFLHEKRALTAAGLTEEQWKLVKPKLEKVRELQNLREMERSTSGLSLGSSTGSGISSTGNSQPSEPLWIWKRPWKDKLPAELSEGQKIAEELIRLLDKKSATPEQFKQKIDALRKARIAEEPEKERREKELVEAKQELHKGLTTRQNATLVLMGQL